MRSSTLRRAAISVSLAGITLALVAPAQSPSVPSELFAKTFDAHWERLRDDYPYFDLYDVDWLAEREEHRPRAIAAENETEFAWEIARLISALPDPHVSFMPSIATMKDRWSYQDLEAHFVERQLLVTAWPVGTNPVVPPAFADDPHACPAIVSVRGESLSSATEVLAAGPLGTSFELRLRWPDGSETDHELKRPDESNLPPKKAHFGTRWLVSAQIGSIGYMRVRTFDPDRATLGPDGKMTTMLRAALAELKSADGLIIDVQRNGGGQVPASDPFIGHLLERSMSYRWGNADGKRRVIRAQKPRYSGDIVVLVDERTASGGEWLARILHDAGRAVVIGGRTMGAEAAVHTSKGPDGSVVRFSAWPMIEPGVEPFQERGAAAAC